MAQHPFDNGNMGGRDENLAPWPRTREVIGDQLAEYYGMVTHLDDQIGRVLQALQASGRAASTYVIYAADNGLAMGSHGLLGKQNIYEHSQRVPLIIGGPGVPKGQSTHALTYLVDVPATILRLASVDAPGALDGQDLAPLWSGQKKQLRDTLFLAYTNLMRSVRDHRYKLIRYPQIGYTQLFDLESDPDELNNLAETPGQAERVERMMKSIERWQKDLGDTQPLSAANPKPKHIDMTGTPRKPDPWQPAWIVDKYFR
jgi:arylsulfatase A-like enzyme